MLRRSNNIFNARGRSTTADTHRRRMRSRQTGDGFTRISVFYIHTWKTTVRRVRNVLTTLFIPPVAATVARVY